MYSLFEIRKVLSLSKPGGKKEVIILHSAYSENKDHSILALVCDNDYILFWCLSSNLTAPVVRQLCWFSNPEKKIKALCFDPTGLWLLTITQDTTLYVLPMSAVVNCPHKSAASWKPDNLTEIKLTGQRALITSVQWWKTHEAEQIAIIGSELGEISFINLINKKEVGGTYITSGIHALDILYDESHDTTYLLITGNNQQQWRLLLEERKSNLFWPFKSDSDAPSYSCEKNLLTGSKAPGPEDRNEDQRPHRLSKFESGTILTPQCGYGRNLVSAYNSSSCLLQVLEGNLDQMHLFSYKVPSNCDYIILSEKLIFAVSKSKLPEQHVLKIISRKFAEISAENAKKRECQNSEIQTFFFDNEILSIYKAIFPQFSSTATENGHSSSDSSDKRGLFKEHLSYFDTLLSKNKNLEGCLLIGRDSVWQCKLRISAETLFLNLTATTSDLLLAEKLGVMLGLDFQKLYDVAADVQLSSGQFAQAVHLYQLSKCPQLKRVAHFMGYGYLSELIAYIQVLFSTKGVEIVSADKCHFANIALHCFAHQVKSKLLDKHVIKSAFKKFLKENSYYDEEVAAKLFSEQGLYDLLYYFATVRGEQGLVVETLLSTDGIKSTVSESVHKILFSSGYEVLLQHSSDENYIKCLTSYNLLQFMAGNPSLLNQHLQLLISLLPKMNVSLLRRVVLLYNPSRHIAKLFFRNLAASKLNKRYWSVSSLNTLAAEIHGVTCKDEEISSVEDVIKFFIFVLLILFHKLGSPKFNKEYVQKVSFVNSSMNRATSCELGTINSSPISCGQGHVAYFQDGILYTWGKSGFGRLGVEDSMDVEYQHPQPVLTLLRLQVMVVAVACGAQHTLALTNFGLFGWGSSRYGQVGIGEVQQTSQPRIIETLISERIVKICCGQYHSVALNSSGSVFTWGWGVHGQLGHGNAEDIFFPKCVESLKKKKIVSISAGQGHTVVLSKNGSVYTFGCGMFGQLGTGTVLKHSCPQHVVIPERMRIIASGYFHVLAVGRINHVYTWGCNPQALRLQAQNSRRARHHGSLVTQNSSSTSSISSTIINSSNLQRSSVVNGSVQQCHLSPNLVNFSALNEAIIEVSCGNHHSAIVTTCGKVYSWGRNSEGQVGNGTRKEQKIPILITSLKDKRIQHIACGADFTVAVDSLGKIYGWGQNDGCQVGQKPSFEQSTKCSSGTTSGRVITIRTNRRMITITQPCRQSILRPVEIVIPHNELRGSGILDSGSFENEHSAVKLLSHQYSAFSFFEQPLDTSALHDPVNGPAVLHASLEGFHTLCDYSALLNYCLSFTNFQAAAKLCALEKAYDEAVDYQLRALGSISNGRDVDLEIVLYVLNTYANMLNSENSEVNEKFISHVIQFWMKYNLPLNPLELFLLHHHRIFSHHLCLIMFSKQVPALNDEIRTEFLKSLSSKFCLYIIEESLKEAEKDCYFVRLLEKIQALPETLDILNTVSMSESNTLWDVSLPQDRLWRDIIHNLQFGVNSHSAIFLTSNDLDILAKSLLCAKFSSKSFNTTPTNLKINSSGSDVIIFSCGHNYSIPEFQMNTFPLLKNTLQTFALPQTLKYFVTEYQHEIITAACPKCVAAEVIDDA